MGMDRAKDIWRNPSNLSPNQKKIDGPIHPWITLG